MSLKLGAAATLNLNTGSLTAPTWTVVNSVTGDVQVAIQFHTAEVSYRGSGVVTKEPTLMEFTLTFKILGDPAATGFSNLRSAFYARSSLDCLVSSGGATTTGEIYERAAFKVTEFQRAEPLDGNVTYDVKLEPCYSLTQSFSQGTN